MKNLIILLLLVSLPSQAARLNHEKYYQELWCEGVTEYRLADKTRVDCLTETHAIEFDFANKWAEAIGQSLHYSRMTGKYAGIVLIVEDTKRDMKYIARTRSIIKEFNLPIELNVLTH